MNSFLLEGKTVRIIDSDPENQFLYLPGYITSKRFENPTFMNQINKVVDQSVEEKAFVGDSSSPFFFAKLRKFLGRFEVGSGEILIVKTGLYYGYEKLVL